MTAIKSRTVWIAYAVVYALGFAGLMYLTRSALPGWATLWPPFAFPVILLGIGALGAQVDAEVPPRQESGVSLLGRGVGGIQHEPLRPTTLVAVTMLTPFSTWMFPAEIGIPSIRPIFLGWWFACAAFAALALPRLINPNPH